MANLYTQMDTDKLVTYDADSEGDEYTNVTLVYVADDSGVQPATVHYNIGHVELDDDNLYVHKHSRTGYSEDGFETADEALQALVQTYLDWYYSDVESED